MSFNMTGKVVGVTGSAQGLGKAIAKRFLDEGCKLILCDMNPVRLEETKKEFEKLGAEVFTGAVDVSQPEPLKDLIDRAAAHYGKIDVWVNNAGVTGANDLLDVTPEEWDRVFAINTKSVFLGAKYVFPHMKANGGGVIINAASFTSIIPSANIGVYSATKSANLSLTRTLAGEFAPYNIRVCAYTPGYMLTEMNTTGEYANKEKHIRPIALQRGGEAEDLAGPVVFLASDYASYITGVTIEVSGGKLCVQNAWYPWEKAREKGDI